MKKIISLTVLAGLLLATVLPAVAATPTQTLKDGLDKLVSIVNDPVYDVEGPLPEEQVERLSDTVAQFFDYGELTKRAVGRAWLDFTDQQRSSLTDAFRELLEKTYLKKLQDNYLDELKSFKTDSILFDDEKIQGDKSMVFTTFKLTDKNLGVNFRLIEKDGRWLVYDIIGEGVTLLGVYKDDFQAALTKMTPEELVEHIKQKTADVEAGKVEDATILDKPQN